MHFREVKKDIFRLKHVVEMKNHKRTWEKWLVKDLVERICQSVASIFIAWSGECCVKHHSRNSTQPRSIKQIHAHYGGFISIFRAKQIIKVTVIVLRQGLHAITDRLECVQKKKTRKNCNLLFGSALARSLPRLCHEKRNVIDINVRKEKSSNLNLIFARSSLLITSST